MKFARLTVTDKWHFLLNYNRSNSSNAPNDARGRLAINFIKAICTFIKGKEMGLAQINWYNSILMF